MHQIESSQAFSFEGNIPLTLPFQAIKKYKLFDVTKFILPVLTTGFGVSILSKNSLMHLSIKSRG